MALLHDIVLLTDDDWTTLYTTGTVTVGGVTVTYRGDNLHFTDKVESELIDDTNSTKKFVTNVVDHGTYISLTIGGTTYDLVKN